MHNRQFKRHLSYLFKTTGNAMKILLCYTDDYITLNRSNLSGVHFTFGSQKQYASGLCYPAGLNIRLILGPLSVAG